MTLFAGGIHGVGKSTLCGQAFERLGYCCTSASTLIAAHCRRTGKEYGARNIQDNQESLLRELALVREQHQKILVDGHYTLRNSEGEVEPIDPNVFQRMTLDRLILIKGDVEEVSRRLAERDGKIWDISLLKNFQIAEELHAKRVSDTLGIPLQTFNNTISPERLAELVLATDR